MGHFSAQILTRTYETKQQVKIHQNLHPIIFIRQPSPNLV